MASQIINNRSQNLNFDPKSYVTRGEFEAFKGEFTSKFNAFQNDVGNNFNSMNSKLNDIYNILNSQKISTNSNKKKNNNKNN